MLTYFLIWVAAALGGVSPLSSIKKIIVFHRPLVFYVLLFAYRGELIPSALCGMGVGAGLNVLYGWGQLALWQWIYDYANGSQPAWLMRVPENWRAYLTLSPGQGRIHGAFHLLTYSELLLPPFFFFGARFLEKGKSQLYLLAFLLAGGALIYTAERGPFLGALVGLSLMAFHHPRRRRLIGPVSILMLILWFNPVFRHRMLGIPLSTQETSTALSHRGNGGEPVGKIAQKNGGPHFFAKQIENINNNHRVNLWRGGLYIVSRHPFLGVGPGQIGSVTAIYKNNADFPQIQTDKKTISIVFISKGWLKWDFLD
ncbi:MAG: O-antigen ligase family protein [Elusimicrobia bacterium]|nr:O-antigen ligase family protein [Elusimicrobiota bacterium]